MSYDPLPFGLPGETISDAVPANPPLIINVPGVPVTDVAKAGYGVLRIIASPVSFTLAGKMSMTAPAASLMRIISFPCDFLITGIYHVINEAKYLSEPILVSRVYVIGMDSDGNMVYGEDSTTQNIELIKPYADQMIQTSDAAEDVATNILVKDALECNRGEIVIPPNVGMELWDVISAEDMDKAAQTYRVSGWTFDYNNSVNGEPSKYEHRARLTSVGRNV